MRSCLLANPLFGRICSYMTKLNKLAWEFRIIGWVSLVAALISLVGIAILTVVFIGSSDAIQRQAQESEAWRQAMFIIKLTAFGFIPAIAVLFFVSGMTILH